MAEFNFCTISTKSHLFKCAALANSLSSFKGHLHVLIVDSSDPIELVVPNLSIYYLDDIDSKLGSQIIKKYHSKLDELRWSLKPVLLSKLLSQFDEVIYVDNDIHFFNDFSFLFDDLKQHSILLTPHDYPRSPKEDQNWFEANFRVGLFNAGFIGVNKNAINVLNWWGEACLYRCEKNYWRGLFDDQKYLDLIPIMEESCKIIHHKGCNVAAWNKGLRKCDYINQVHVVNDSTPLVFYHFNQFSLNELDPKDQVLIDYLKSLSQFEYAESYFPKANKTSNIDKLKLGIWKLLNKLN